MMGVTRRSLKLLTFAFLGAAVALAGATAVKAADDPANILKYRKSVMQANGVHIGAIAAVVKGEVSYSGHVAAHARALHATSMMVSDVFPPGSAVGDSRANPEIWQEPAKFAAAVKALQTESGELARVAESGDMAAIGAQLKKVGQACGGCHKPFRKKKE